MSVREHVYPIPTEDELSQLVGAATPHFALQIRDRIVSFATRLPPGHARQPEMARHVARLEAMAVQGQVVDAPAHDLPARPSIGGTPREAQDGEL